MAKFKTLPNYEFIRDGVHIVFNGYGIYETNEEKKIKALENAKPFIERIDKQEPIAEEQPENNPNQVEEYEPEHVGGGYYALSNGEKVKGKEAAIKAEAALKK